MSLLERARKVDSALEGGHAPEGTADQLLRLRSSVERLVSLDDMAVLVAENPERARNEIKSACSRVFLEREWLELSDVQRRDLVRRLTDSVFGFGPIERLLTDPTVTEIMVNAPDLVFFERDGIIHRSEQRFPNQEALRALVDRMISPLGRRVDEASPMVDARLPEGHRVNVVISPLYLDGTALTIRKFPERVMTLADLQERNSLDASVRTFLTWAVRARKSIAVSGGTGSGKTTLLNALSCEIEKRERIITIEDSAELRFFEHPHVLRLEARARNAEGLGEVTIRDLVINALRMRPDRIVVGECRGAEALDMLQAMNTGHDGSLTTLHANSSAEAISRLATMVRYAVDLPVDVIERNISSALHLVVQTERSMDGSRRICEIAGLSFDEGSRRCISETLYSWDARLGRGMWHMLPKWVEHMPDFGIADSGEVERWRCSLPR